MTIYNNIVDQEPQKYDELPVTLLSINDTVKIENGIIQTLLYYTLLIF